MAKSIVSELLSIFRVSYEAVLPEELVRQTVHYNKISQGLTIANDYYNLKNKNVYVVGTGKAVQDMSRKLEDVLISKIKGGIVSIPAGSLNYSWKTHNNIKYCEGAENNLPDRNAENTAKHIKNLVTKLGSDDFLIVLISGGGSALLPLPKAPVNLEEKTGLIKKLANSGADIKELNIVRTKLSDLKGGQLAMYAQPAQVVSLILSDIVGDPLDLIASGPTTNTLTKSSEVKNILYKYSLLGNLPKSIEQLLQTVEVNDKPFPSVRNYIIGSNKLSIAEASKEAKKIGYKPIQISHTITGNINDIARKYLEMTQTFCNWLKNRTTINNIKSELINILKLPVNYDFELGINKEDNQKGICLVLGGETTVLVSGNGKGGRNQQLALEFSILLDEEKQCFKDFDVYFLSAGTDGIDGPTDAAGAVGYLDLVSDAINDNIDISTYINRNDSYNFYKEFRNGKFHVVTGHTGTNVMDIHLIMINNKCVNNV